MIDIIWTYDKHVHQGEQKKNNLINYYKRSMYDAKMFGHHTTIYTNDLIFKDLDYVDRLEWTNTPDILFWDEFKRFPLENTNKDFVLADGDIIWHQPFNVNKNVDLLIDSYEEFNWNVLYEIDVNTLSYLKIQEVIPEWDGKRRAAFCTGILSFNNKEFQELYLDRYLKFKEFVIQYKHMLNVSKCTAIGAQYLLATIADVKGYSHYAYSKVPRENNGIYTHYAGKKKLKDSFLPKTDKHPF